MPTGAQILLTDSGGRTSPLIPGQQSPALSLPVVQADRSGFAYESITVSTSAVGPTEATYAPADESPATAVIISVETNGIRFRYDGGEPTSSIGHALASGATYELPGAVNVSQLRMIRSGGADATVHLTYER